MPIYEYQATDLNVGCEQCRRGIEKLQRLGEPALTQCPYCGSPVRKVMSAHAVGFSRSGLDQRAKSAGFTKFQRIGKGEYERKF